MIDDPRRNAEEGMQCLAAEVERCDACGRKKYLLFAAILLERIEKRRLSSACTTEDHDCGGGTVQKLKRAIRGR
jgi:endonuclease IV